MRQQIGVPVGFWHEDESNLFLRIKEDIEKYFPGENLVGMLFKAHGCSSWDEYYTLQGDWDRCLKEAQVCHVSNITGIGVHLSPEDEEHWGTDGAFEGHLSKQQLRDIFYQAKKNNKVVVVEVAMDLENKTFQEILSFLRWLRN